MRGWYRNIKSRQRLLSLQEVAAACGTTSSKVRNWLSDMKLASGQSDEQFVDASEVISFLVRNSLPVPSLLLPPETRKILFVATHEYEFLDHADQFDVICRYFSEHCNVLVETSTPGKPADLAILTFSPDVVVLFLSSLNQAVANTLFFISNLQPLETILLVDDAIRHSVASDLTVPPRHLVVSSSSPLRQLNYQLHMAFDA